MSQCNTKVHKAPRYNSKNIYKEAKYWCTNRILEIFKQKTNCQCQGKNDLLGNVDPALHVAPLCGSC